MSTDNSFTIHDNNSQILSILPPNYVEPLIMISRILGYNGIDDFVLELIKDRLEMYSDTRDSIDDDFQKYMHNTIKGKDVPNEWASNKEEMDNDKGADEFVKDVQENYHEMKKSEDEDLR
jgi:hypothetical protein